MTIPTDRRSATPTVPWQHSAALAKVGQGSVTEVERDDDSGAAYEVEVRLNDGSQVEVALGADFQVMSQSAPEHDED